MMESLLFILFLLVFSACFSSLETALFSLNRVARQRLRESGSFFSLVDRVLEHPRKVLTTLLLGNELVNVSISILAGSLAYHFFGPDQSRLQYFMITALTTLTILIFGEIIPKNIAIRRSMMVSQFLILPYQAFSTVTRPIRWLITWITDRIVSLFGVDPVNARRLIVEEELRNLLDEGKKKGTLEDLERTLLQTTLDLSRHLVTEVMVPMDKIVSIYVDMPLEDIFGLVEKHRFSRFPVYEGRVDNVIGILHAKDLLPWKLNPTNGFSMRGILKRPLFFRPQERLDLVFQKFKQGKSHMGFIFDESSRMVGLATLEDLMKRFF